MIGPHLPPGVKVECIVAPIDPFFSGPVPIVGGVYTTDGYDEPEFVYLVEMQGSNPRGNRYSYLTKFFRVVQLPPLPASITDCLNVRPKVDA